MTPRAPVEAKNARSVLVITSKIYFDIDIFVPSNINHLSCHDFISERVFKNQVKSLCSNRSSLYKINKKISRDIQHFSHLPFEEKKKVVYES